MVTITGYEKRESDKGEFFLLTLQGDVEFTYSQTTGLPYATVKKCNMPSTFDETTCKSLIGRQIQGSIVKIEVEPYEYTVPETGEVKSLDYQYAYSSQEETTAEHAVFEKQTLVERGSLV